MCKSHKQLGENPDLKASIRLWVGLTETFVSICSWTCQMDYETNDLLAIPQWVFTKIIPFWLFQM